MSAAFVTSKTVTSSRSGCFSSRFSRTAAGARRFTFRRNRTGSIDSSPLSIPLKKNETIQQHKMMNPIIMPQRSVARCFLQCAAGCFFQQNFLDPFTPRAPHRNREPRQVESVSRRRQVAQPRKNKSTDRVDSFGSIWKPRYSLKSSRRAFPLTRNFPSSSGSMYRSASPRGKRVAKNFFHDIVHGNDSFGAAKFVNHHSQSLGDESERA